MAKRQVNGVELHYIEKGKGDETIVFSHGYLMNHTMFSHQIEALSQRYRVIAYDHRGHGESAGFKRPFTIYDLMEDAAALIERLVDGPVHFIGMSTGGYVGVRLMVRRPELLNSAVLIDCGAGAESLPKLAQYHLMLMSVRLFGVRSVFKRAIAILMGEKFRSDPARRSEYEQWKRAIHKLDKTNLYHFGRAIFGRDSVIDQIGTFDKPVLVLVGEKDIATPPKRSKEMVAVLPNAELVTIPDAGHTSPVETPAAVTKAISAFLRQQASQ